MTSDVVLTAALRNNLLSLQNTQSLIDKTQIRLATGLKVNSALDNPQNFFAAQTLSNRAGDLSRLLDGIGQSITAIKQASTSIESLTTLVEQADSIATQARDALAGGQQEARIVDRAMFANAGENILQRTPLRRMIKSIIRSKPRPNPEEGAPPNCRSSRYHQSSSSGISNSWMRCKRTS